MKNDFHLQVKSRDKEIEDLKKIMEQQQQTTMEMMRQMQLQITKGTMPVVVGCIYLLTSKSVDKSLQRRKSSRKSCHWSVLSKVLFRVLSGVSPPDKTRDRKKGSPDRGTPREDSGYHPNQDSWYLSGEQLLIHRGSTPLPVNTRVFHNHTKLAMLALLPTLYSHTFAVFFFICNIWCQ